MKISYYVPKGKKNIVGFIDKEINSAKNIKSKLTQNIVLDGLNKIKQNLVDGKAYLWDDNKLKIYNYDGNDFLYYCGKELKTELLNPYKKNKYILITMDANECTIGMLKGKKIITLWNEQSQVPNKHNKGGQSAQRFARGREEALKHWFKICSNKLKEIYYQGIKIPKSE